MNLLYATLAWLFISFLFALGIYFFAVHGTFWLLALVVIGFIVAVGKIGCATH